MQVLWALVLGAGTRVLHYSFLSVCSPLLPKLGALWMQGSCVGQVFLLGAQTGAFETVFCRMSEWGFVLGVLGEGLCSLHPGGCGSLGLCSWGRPGGP